MVEVINTEHVQIMHTPKERLCIHQRNAVCHVCMSYVMFCKCLSLSLFLSFSYFWRNSSLSVIKNCSCEKKDCIYSFSLHPPGQKDGKWMYIKRSQDVVHIFQTFYVSSILVLFPESLKCFNICEDKIWPKSLH